MKKYQITMDIPEYSLKKGMIFTWDKGEYCYTTKSLPWFLTPLIEKGELKKRIKIGQFKEIE